MDRMMDISDEGIRLLNGRMEGLPAERLGDCRQSTVAAYKETTIGPKLFQVHEEADRRPSDYRVFCVPGRLPMRRFVDPSVHWDFAASQIGRQIAFKEMEYLHDLLKERITLYSPQAPDTDPFDFLFTQTWALAREGFRPDVLLAPMEALASLEMRRYSGFVWTSSLDATLTAPNGLKLSVFSSNGAFPLNDRFVVLDSRFANWSVKPDPATGNYLSVGIGRFQGGIRELAWVAKSIVRFEILDQGAFRAIPWKADAETDTQNGGINHG